MQARRLESELESTLSQYGRMANTYQYGARGETGLNADQVPTVRIEHRVSLKDVEV